MSAGDIFLALIAILFPPIAVWIKSGFCTADSLINILLCVLGYIPGLLHAWYIIARHPETNYDYEPIGDPESQRVTYYYVSHEPAGGRDYGTQQQQGSVAKPAKKPQRQQQQKSGVVRNNETNASSAAEPSHQPDGPSQGAGSENPGAPPSYSDVVKGDNKVQSDE